MLSRPVFLQSNMKEKQTALFRRIYNKIVGLEQSSVGHLIIPPPPHPPILSPQILNWIYFVATPSVFTPPPPPPTFKLCSYIARDYVKIARAPWGLRSYMPTKLVVVVVGGGGGGADEIILIFKNEKLHKMHYIVCIFLYACNKEWKENFVLTVKGQPAELARFWRSPPILRLWSLRLIVTASLVSICVSLNSTVAAVGSVHFEE